MHLPSLHHTAHSTTPTALAGGRSLLHRIGRDAVVDWACILALSASITLILIAIGVISYRDMDERLSEESAAEVPPAPKTLQAADLQNILEKYNAREAAREALLRSYPGPADPSL